MKSINESPFLCLALSPADRTLELKRVIAVRSENLSGCEKLYYLSLIADEIDERIEDFVDRLFAAPFYPDLRPENVANWVCGALEPSDVVIIASADNVVTIVRGGAASVPLYSGSVNHTLSLSTFLPDLNSADYSREGLVAFISEGLQGHQFEPNWSRQTAISGWHRVQRGAVTTISADDQISIQPFSSNILGRENVERRTVIEQLERAYYEYQQRQSGVDRSIIELSGGFDSSIAGAGAIHESNNMRGFSIEFPYYEFRYEEELQLASARQLNVSRTIVDGDGLGPFSPSQYIALLDEPNLLVTGLREAEASGELAKRHKALKVYTGHGGDNLFCKSLITPRTKFNAPKSQFFTPGLRYEIQKAQNDVSGTAWTSRATGMFIHSQIQEFWLQERFGAIIRTPFTDLSFFKAAALWSQYCAANGTQIDKSILAEAFQIQIPDAIRRRKGKIDYIGVWVRAYRRYHNEIRSTIELQRKTLEALGLRVSAILGALQPLQNGQKRGSVELSIAYALSVWLTNRER